MAWREAPALAPQYPAIQRFIEQRQNRIHLIDALPGVGIVYYRRTSARFVLRSIMPVTGWDIGKFVPSETLR